MEDKTIYPTFVIPIGNDGSTGHAICIVDDLIFDSTQENALILGREYLDWICGKIEYKDIYVAIRFKPLINRKHCNSAFVYVA